MEADFTDIRNNSQREDRIDELIEDESVRAEIIMNRLDHEKMITASKGDNIKLIEDYQMDIENKNPMTEQTKEGRE